QRKRRIMGIWHKTCVCCLMTTCTDAKMSFSNEPDSTGTSFGGNGRGSRARIRAGTLGLLTAAGVYFCYRLAKPCLASLLWAGALALIFTPLQRWMEGRVKRRSVAAALSLAIIGLLVVAPATWFTQKLAEQAIAVPQHIQKQLAAGKWHTHREGDSRLDRFL